MIGLFYDTETTGLPLFNEPSEDPRQPHLVQLAAALVDLDDKAVIASMDVVIRPNGWPIPDEVAKIHGITTERALEVGVAEETAIEMLLDLHNWRTRIAHNEAFDARIIRIGLLRHGYDRQIADQWKQAKAECTQALSTPILKLPPTPRMLAAGRNHYKSANLGEAYRHFTGQQLAGAHNALVDVRACMDVYFAIKRGTACSSSPAA